MLEPCGADGQAGKAPIVTALGKDGPLATLNVYQKDEK